MITTPFLLEDQFEVTPELNSVRDRVADKKVRLEPRIMRLLCLFIEHQGQVVSREYITREIWNDYGNADEALSQSISYLRKVLSDDEKKRIETVPKKGYVLRAKVSELTTQKKDTVEAEVKLNHPPGRKTVVITLAIVGVALALFLFILRFDKGSELSPDIRPGLEGNNPETDQPHGSNGKSDDILNVDSTSDLRMDSLKKK